MKGIRPSSPQMARGRLLAAALAIWRMLSARALSLWLLLALAFLSALGTLFPQRLPSVALTEEGTVEWEVALQMRYGPGLASFLGGLGLLDLYRAPLFQAVLVALVVNGLACTLARIPDQWRILWARPRPAPPPGPFPPGVWSARVALPGHADQAEAAVREACRRVGLHPRVERLGAAVAFVAEQGRWTALGTLAEHLGLAVVAVGLLLGVVQGARARTPPLTVGQEYPLPWAPDLVLRVQEFRVERYPDGHARAYLLWIALARGDEGSGAPQMVQLGAPASLPGGGLAFFYGYGPAVRVDAYGVDGSALVSGASVPLAPSASLPLPDGTSLVAERVAGLPGQYHLQRWKGGVLVAEATVPAESALPLGDLEVRVAPDWYVVLEVARDPGFPWVVAGVIVALAAAGVALGGRWRQVRGFWREGELLLWTREAGAGSLGARAWHRLVREAALAGGGEPTEVERP